MFKEGLGNEAREAGFQVIEKRNKYRGVFQIIECKGKAGIQLPDIACDPGLVSEAASALGANALGIAEGDAPSGGHLQSWIVKGDYF